MSTLLHVQCNDPDNGNERQWAAGINLLELELEPTNKRGGYKFTVEGGTIRIHGANYVIEGRKVWFGNWCWDAFTMPTSEAKRLLRDLKASSRWSVTAGPADLCDWFDGIE